MIGVTRGFLKKFYATISALNLKANSASPALTGTPTVPTASAGTNTTQIASTAFVVTMAGGATTPAKSLAANGYIKLANGLILQWGDSGVNASVTFPITFPTACKNVQISFRDEGGGAAFTSGYMAADSITTSGFTYGYTSTSINRFWLAIGY